MVGNNFEILEILFDIKEKDGEWFARCKACSYMIYGESERDFVREIVKHYLHELSKVEVLLKHISLLVDCLREIDSSFEEVDGDEKV